MVENNSCLSLVLRRGLIGSKRGFTLLEILVVVLIIGILGAIMLPQYQRAVLKSRFAALMPIAKSMADSNEAYYLEHGEYADNAEDLPVQGRRNYSDGTELEFGTTTSHAYVLATRDNNFPNNYIVYQKHSTNYPGEIHCEAATDNTQAQEVCKSFGPTEDIGETLTSGYLTYVLSGTGNGEAPTGDNGGNEEDDTGDDNSGGTSGTSTEPEDPEPFTCPSNASCDDQGNITCNTGYVLNGTACEADPAALQAVAAARCPANQPQYVCTIKNGTVSRCNTNYGTINEQGECVSNGTGTGDYEVVYNPDGTYKQLYNCSGVSDGHCYNGYVHDYAAGTGKERECAGKAAISKDLTCANGYANSGLDKTYEAHGREADSNVCSVVNEQGVCTAYRQMAHYDYTYDGDTWTGYMESQCASISGTTCNNYTNRYANKTNGTSTTYVQCYNSSGSGTTISVNGTCPSGYSIKQRTYQNGQNTYTDCTSYDTVDWANVTCS